MLIKDFKVTDMNQNIASLKTELTDMVAAANDLPALEQARVTALGKKGRITDLMKNLGAMDPEARKALGAALNELKDEIAALIEKQETALKSQALNDRLAHAGTIEPVAAQQVWSEYVVPWVRWNTLRAVLHTASVAVLAAGLVLTRG